MFAPTPPSQIPMKSRPHPLKSRILKPKPEDLFENPVGGQIQQQKEKIEKNSNSFNEFAPRPDREIFLRTSRNSESSNSSSLNVPHIFISLISEENASAPQQTIQNIECSSPNSSLGTERKYKQTKLSQGKYPIRSVSAPRERATQSNHISLVTPQKQPFSNSKSVVHPQSSKISSITQHRRQMSNPNIRTANIKDEDKYQNKLKEDANAMQNGSKLNTVKSQEMNRLGAMIPFSEQLALFESEKQTITPLPQTRRQTQYSTPNTSPLSAPMFINSNSLQKQLESPKVITSSVNPMDTRQNRSDGTPREQSHFIPHSAPSTTFVPRSYSSTSVLSSQAAGFPGNASAPLFPTHYPPSSQLLFQTANTPSKIGFTFEKSTPSQMDLIANKSGFPKIISYKTSARLLDSSERDEASLPLSSSATPYSSASSSIYNSGVHNNSQPVNQQSFSTPFQPVLVKTNTKIQQQLQQHIAATHTPLRSFASDTINSRYQNMDRMQPSNRTNALPIRSTPLQRSKFADFQNESKTTVMKHRRSLSISQSSSLSSSTSSVPLATPFPSPSAASRPKSSSTPSSPRKIQSTPRTRVTASPKVIYPKKKPRPRIEPFSVQTGRSNKTVVKNEVDDRVRHQILHRNDKEKMMAIQERRQLLKQSDDNEKTYFKEQIRAEANNKEFADVEPIDALQVDQEKRVNERVKEGNKSNSEKAEIESQKTRRGSAEWIKEALEIEEVVVEEKQRLKQERKREKAKKRNERTILEERRKKKGKKGLDSQPSAGTANKVETSLSDSTEDDNEMSLFELSCLSDGFVKSQQQEVIKSLMESFENISEKYQPEMNGEGGEIQKTKKEEEEEEEEYEEYEEYEEEEEEEGQGQGIEAEKIKGSNKTDESAKSKEASTKCSSFKDEGTEQNEALQNNSQLSSIEGNTNEVRTNVSKLRQNSTEMPTKQKRTEESRSSSTTHRHSSKHHSSPKKSESSSSESTADSALSHSDSKESMLSASSSSTYSSFSSTSSSSTDSDDTASIASNSSSFSTSSSSSSKTATSITSSFSSSKSFHSTDTIPSLLCSPPLPSQADTNIFSPSSPPLDADVPRSRAHSHLRSQTSHHSAHSPNRHSYSPILSTSPPSHSDHLNTSPQSSSSSSFSSSLLLETPPHSSTLQHFPSPIHSSTPDSATLPYQSDKLQMSTGTPITQSQQAANDKSPQTIDSPADFEENMHSAKNDRSGSSLLDECSTQLFELSESELLTPQTGTHQHFSLGTLSMSRQPDHPLSTPQASKQKKSSIHSSMMSSSGSSLKMQQNKASTSTPTQKPSMVFRMSWDELDDS
ncbi:uncharacterized protein MONOS_11065 [Monocercomonoides exilis]|uniref:uncharacterized protein n=1 Tax=Monocercomonoides exilis TaxID=2049356 RepID=UPI00355A3F4D|nr:hypothetical protein MONOS_11065 [Monocercomonoides exilis]|eukprot:MONOS_11065.1-p1 / transcript=MONOS_11065.1 / gene=MONOS_11065 / organism=Monocercomonoides_exilis_PA203 / gene_product=unspecified product / transcript_product=unspecified product / location=Mono_scaffold00534:10138-14300(+) / protein_length=1319 / sequence_SO=supercontig / SO=protein_coding / is_pseudo=false